VIAANHGGLSEIVIDGVTGSFVEPGSVESLAIAIAIYAMEPTKALSEGEEGRKRFAAEFEEGLYKRRIADVIDELVNRAGVTHQDPAVGYP
jgi:glycosyltransferase involved in cell wall biosynthesis